MTPTKRLSEWGACNPPYAKPPLVSSSGAPPACMTPSRVTNSRTMTFLMTEFLQPLATSQEAVLLRWAFRRAQRHASFLFCGSSPKTGTDKKDRRESNFSPGGGLNPSFHSKTRSQLDFIHSGRVTEQTGQVVEQGTRDFLAIGLTGQCGETRLGPQPLADEREGIAERRRRLGVQSGLLP